MMLHLKNSGLSSEDVGPIRSYLSHLACPAEASAKAEGREAVTPALYSPLPIRHSLCYFPTNVRRGRRSPNASLFAIDARIFMKIFQRGAGIWSRVAKMRLEPQASIDLLLSKYPLVVVGTLLLLSLAPFANKAIQTDDALFVWTGQWIQKHPVDFFGGTVNWFGDAIPMWAANWNPPLMSFFLAGTAAVFGWNEIAMHLACLAIAFVAAAGTYVLARLWCKSPLLATLIAIVTPAFLVTGTTLMCDLLMLTFWVWAIIFWERALKDEASRWDLIAAGVLAGLAVLTKYSGVLLLPLLVFLGILRTRRFLACLPGLLIPVAVIVGYEWLTTKLYGRGLFFDAEQHAHLNRFGFPGGWMAKVIISLAFAGGSLLPILFFAPWLWRWRTWTAGSIVILGGILGAFWIFGDPGLIHPWMNQGIWKFWGFRLQVALLMLAGAHVLLLAATEFWQRRDLITIILVAWIVGIFLFAGVLNWTINARSFLIMAPAIAILAVRRFDRLNQGSTSNLWLLIPLFPALFLSLNLVLADYKTANLAKTMAEQISTKYQPQHHQLWFEGHGGFQYYMEALGARPLDGKRSTLQPQDVVAVLWDSGSYVILPPGSVAPLAMMAPQTHSWVTLSGNSPYGLAGFYDADWGPVPFTIGESDSGYLIAKIFEKIEYPLQANGPNKTNGIPALADTSAPSSDNPNATRQIQLAGEEESRGEIEPAIQCYRKALTLDPGNIVALNNLAWILSTADDPAMRNGYEALQLAMKAAKLSKWRQPAVVITLSAAYAEEGQFSNAVTMAQAANEISMLTGQSALAARTTQLQDLYSAGRTVNSAGKAR
jgi:tetratricopeptide (TPR) repeat protein